MRPRFPGKAFGVFFLMDLMLWGMQAANAVPFVMLLGLIALWFFVSVPLTCFGGALGCAPSASSFVPPQVFCSFTPVIFGKQQGRGCLLGIPDQQDP